MDQIEDEMRITEARAMSRSYVALRPKYNGCRLVFADGGEI